MLVQGVNMIKKNTKVDYQGAARRQGGRHRAHQEALIHVSNVQLIDPDTKKPARAGYRRDEDGTARSGSPAPSGKDI